MVDRHAGAPRGRGSSLGALRPAVLALLLLVPALASAQSPVIRYVDPADPTCGGHSPCYSTIQAAVTAAQPGDTVRVLTGTYVEQVSVLGKNSGGSATEGDRIVIEAEPSLPPGSVVIAGAVSQCTNGHAVRFQQSRFVTLRGFTITGAGGAAIWLMGGNNENEAVHVERNRILHNGGPECDGGITVNRGNPGTVIANNLIYGNGRKGLSILDQDGGPHYVVGNTIHGNAWTGIWVARNHAVVLANNAVTGNGTASGSTGGRFGALYGEGPCGRKGPGADGCASLPLRRRRSSESRRPFRSSNHDDNSRPRCGESDCRYSELQRDSTYERYATG
jgi:parallel beta-helix repeat protein